MSSSDKKSRGIVFWLGIIFILCVSGWLYLIFYGDSDKAWRALLINFVFFTPLASGMIVWPAVVTASQGIWAKPLQRTAFAAIYFAPVSIAAFIALWIGHSHWAGWATHPNLLQGFWLYYKFVFLRDIIALVLIWALCAAYVARARRGAPGKLAGWLCFAYGVVFTLIAFDMVMALDPHWFSTLFGGYFFVSGMYAALAAWTVLSILSGTTTVEHRHDLGKLTVAVSLLTAYMMYSQLLPIWYENLPAEVRFVIPRMTISQWRYISAVLTATIFLGPLVLLVTRWSKRSPVFLTAVSMLMLVCLWIERWWEVTPTLGGKLTFGLTEASITAAFVAAFLLSVIIFTNRQKTAISG
ncbi:MAG: hypothetical protein ABSG97_02335 [Sedimentisphaerales bacterium]|jgi:hypothetical protein